METFNNVDAKAFSKSSEPAYPAINAIDGDVGRTWVMQSGSGSISLMMSKAITFQKLCFVQRKTASHPILKGLIVLNNNFVINFENFQTRQMLVLDFKEPVTVYKIDFESIKGVNNPGLSEVYYK